MITVQGVAVNSRSAEAPIKTKGDSFLPLAVNVEARRAPGHAAPGRRTTAGAAQEGGWES